VIDIIDIKEFFDAHDDEYGKDDRIRPERRLNRRPDLNAFLLLDRLVPGTHDMVDGAEHDQISLYTDCWELSNVASEEDLLDLIRCGVMYDEEADSLTMFA
jgi:hypothetical protein